ncbi:MAG: pirin family protein, partial [Pyrinomonadaceae bacterium]|nr:pirin family protein [Phycisphaerales bacterium]
KGAATTFSPVILWDVKLSKGAQVDLPVPEGFTLSVFVREGTVDVGNSLIAEKRQLAIFSTAGAGVSLHAPEDCELLIVGGEPIREPMASYGPFVMNTAEEIKEAIEDFRNGRMGELVS